MPCPGTDPWELIGRYLNRLAEKSLRRQRGRERLDLPSWVSRYITKPPFVRLFSRMPGHIDAGLGLNERE
jgi:hypothetical protein